MKKSLTTFLALMGACLIASQGAEAKSLEEVLMEKGLISEAEYKETTKFKPVTYKLGKGFTLTSTSGKFQLTVGGRLKVRYTFNDTDATGTTDCSKFDLQKGQIWLRGYAYSKDLSYHLQFDVAQSGKAKMLEQAYLKYRFLDELRLAGGQTKTPYSRQFLTPVAALEFVDRSPVANAFRPNYDTGVYVSGALLKGMLNYDIAWVGGLGQTKFRASNNNAFAARLAVNPFGKFAYSEGDLDQSPKPLVSLGANYYRDTLKATATYSGTTYVSTAYEDNNLLFAGSKGWLGKNSSWFKITEKIDIDTWSADIAFKWLGAFFQSEYFWGQADGQTSGTTLRAHGFYTQAGYCILPKKLEVAMRYSYMDPNRDKANDNQTEIIGGVSYYFNKHNLKLQADIANIHTQKNTGIATDEMQYRMSAMVNF